MKLSGQYDPSLVENVTVDEHTYRPSGDGNPYSISLPPPNVTGFLHMGHALNHTLQDILIRYARMGGHNTLWQPGTDHAGIATQAVVERRLAAEGKDRRDLGRDAFIEEIWKWKAQSGDRIVEQQKRLGESCDWSRQRFTMDEGLCQAVRKVFVQLYEEGLIYRDKRLVNWDPKLQTAISDLEVEQREVNGSMWQMRYPLADQPDKYIVVATTRPETMFGDTAVAVHPEDERYKDLIGAQVQLPLCDRTIPIVADEYSDPEKGTGAVKITPAHDFNDFEVGKRHDLEAISILDKIGKINENAPAQFQGMDRFEARKAVLNALDKLGLLAGEESNPMTVPYGDRSGVVIEPMLTDQWYVDAHTLAQPAIAAVEQGKTEFVPKNWEKTYFEWMRNIQPWCISRQIWWGHQIPAWYGPDGHIFVAETEEEANASAAKHYGTATELERDRDVLDTWFSSALWPFSTLGWPEQTPELAQFYPNSVLVTGFDIIFFWVARMMMMGLKFMGEVPFHKVYIHALVRDENGEKMSKTKGNVIDPLEIIDQHGADALRFTLTSMAAMGRDIKLSIDRIEGYQHFGNKMWNAVKFCQMQDGFDQAGADAPSPVSAADHWISQQLQKTQLAVQDALDKFRFNDIASLWYSFIWNDFCDWYLEATKISLREHPDQADQIVGHLKWVLRNWLTGLHPVMPYITQYLYNAAIDDQSLDAIAWRSDPSEVGQDDAALFELGKDLIGTIRSARTENNFPPGARIDCWISPQSDLAKQQSERLASIQAWIEGLARCELHIGDCNEKGATERLGDLVIQLPFGTHVDTQAEIARIEKELQKVAAECAKLEGKLGNANFVEKAPPEVVQKSRDQLAEMQARQSTLAQQQQRLAS